MSKTATTSAPTEAAVDVRPTRVTLTERTHLAYPAAIALIRSGWGIDTDYPPVSYENTGFTTIHLTRTKPATEFSALAVDIADKAEQLAADLHMKAYERDVQAAAQHLVETEKKAAKAAELEAEIAAQRAALQALEAAAKASA